MSLNANVKHRVVTDVGPAVAFGYLECLLKLKSESMIDAEQARIRSWSLWLTRLGYDSRSLENFSEQAFALVRIALMEDDGGGALVKAFNDFATRRMVTAAIKVLCFPTDH